MRALLLIAALSFLAAPAHARAVVFAGNTQTHGIVVPPKRVLPPPRAPTPVNPAGLVKFNPYSAGKRVPGRVK